MSSTIKKVQASDKQAVQTLAIKLNSLTREYGEVDVYSVDIETKTITDHSQDGRLVTYSVWSVEEGKLYFRICAEVDQETVGYWEISHNSIAELNSTMEILSKYLDKGESDEISPHDETGIATIINAVITEFNKQMGA